MTEPTKDKEDDWSELERDAMTPDELDAVAEHLRQAGQARGDDPAPLIDEQLTAIEEYLSDEAHSVPGIARAYLERTVAEVRRLRREGLPWVCSSCGQQVCENNAPAADAMRAGRQHMEVCEKHPLAKALAAARELRDELRYECGYASTEGSLLDRTAWLETNDG